MFNLPIEMTKHLINPKRRTNGPLIKSARKAVADVLIMNTMCDMPATAVPADLIGIRYLVR